MGNLADLEELRLNGNGLTGGIPPALGRLENLTTLHLSGNQLTGCVPMALADVADSDLDRLGLESCGPALATRSFSETTVPPGGQVTVTVAVDDYGDTGEVLETLPPDFEYVSSTLPEDQVSVAGDEVQEATFRLTGETSFTYAVTAPNIESRYTFSGTVVAANSVSHPVGGDARVTVSLTDWLLLRYDADGSGTIGINELSIGIEDYFDGLITRNQLIALIDLYFAGFAS